MDAGHPERRAPALHALVNLWQQRDQSPEDLEELASTVREDPVLSQILDARTRPKPLSSDQERRMQEAIRSKDEVAAQRQDRLRGWQDWREELLAEPDAAFSSDRLRSDVSNVYVWLKAGAQRSRRNVWDGEKLAAAFGPELKERIQKIISGTLAFGHACAVERAIARGAQCDFGLLDHWPVRHLGRI